MADAPSTPAASAVPASPKLVLPPMTVSPGVTRLDRVLDLVTDHEAQFRDHEIRVVDVSARLAAVERAVGVMEARSGAFADGSPYREYPDGDHSNDDGPLDLRSELADARASVARLREETAEALLEVRSEMRSLVEDAKAQKAGFKSVLRDVLDRVASQIDAVQALRARDGDGPSDARTRGSTNGGSAFSANAYASAAELAALAERVSRTESAVASPSPSRRPSSNATVDVATSRRVSETEQRVDALAEELKRLRGDGDASASRRIVAESAVGFVSSDAVSESSTNAAAGGPWNKYMPVDDAVAEQLRQLARRFDEQREETEALKRVFLETRARLGEESPAPDSAARERGGDSRTGDSRVTRSGGASEPTFVSPRVSNRATTRGSVPEDDGLVRLGFGAYAGESMMASTRSIDPRFDEALHRGAPEPKQNSAVLSSPFRTNAIPRNVGFVAEASARSRRGAASRRERADHAAASFREYLAGLPKTDHFRAKGRLSH